MGTSSSLDSTTSEQGYLRRDVSLPGKWAYLYSEDLRPLTVLCISPRGAVVRIEETLIPNREVRFWLPLSEEFEFQANAIVKNQSGELVDLEFNRRDLTAALRLNAYVSFPQWARNKKPDDKISVLVIHPDVQAADALEKYLAAKGYDVDVALGANAGWELANSFQHDMTLVTSRLGLKNAFALCRKLVGEKVTPVLWIQENQDVDAELLILSGACASIRKPFTLEQLHRGIRGLSTFFHSLIVLPAREGVAWSERRPMLVEPTGTLLRTPHTELPRVQHTAKEEPPRVSPKPHVVPTEVSLVTPRSSGVEALPRMEAGKPTTPAAEIAKPTIAPVAPVRPASGGASTATLVVPDAEKEVPRTEGRSQGVAPPEVSKSPYMGVQEAEELREEAQVLQRDATRVTKPTSYTAVLAKGAAEKLPTEKAGGRWAARVAIGVVVLAVGGWYGYSRLSLPEPPRTVLAAPSPPASSLVASSPTEATPLSGLSAVPREREEGNLSTPSTSAPPATSPTQPTMTKGPQAAQPDAGKHTSQGTSKNQESAAKEPSAQPTVTVERLENFRLRTPSREPGGTAASAPEAAPSALGGETPAMPEIVGGSPQLPELSPPAQVEAKAIKRVEPVIPLSAKLYRGAYEVVVVVSIDATGKVTEAHPLKKDSYGFGQAAVQAVKKWTFSPATQNDQAVPSTQVILFVFRGKQ